MDVEKLEPIKSREVYFILKEFQKHTDASGNPTVIDQREVFKSLVEQGIFSTEEEGKFKQFTTSLADEIKILYHQNGALYSLKSEGNLIIANWEDEFEDEGLAGAATSKEEIKKMQADLKTKINKKGAEYFSFSVFISHAFYDFPSIYELCLAMIENNIRPIFWFDTVEEDVPLKLYEKISDADLFLILLSNKAIKSQMTNNEIGFVEGKRYFSKKDDGSLPVLTLKLAVPGFSLKDLEGFYTIGKDIHTGDPTDPNDHPDIIEELKRRYGNIEPISNEKPPTRTMAVTPDGEFIDLKALKPVRSEIISETKEKLGNLFNEFDTEKHEMIKKSKFTQISNVMGKIGFGEWDDFPEADQFVDKLINDISNSADPLYQQRPLNLLKTMIEKGFRSKKIVEFIVPLLLGLSQPDDHEHKLNNKLIPILIASIVKDEVNTDSSIGSLIQIIIAFKDSSPVEQRFHDYSTSISGFEITQKEQIRSTLIEYLDKNPEEKSDLINNVLQWVSS